MYYKFIGDYQKSDEYWKRCVHWAEKICDKTMISLVNQEFGESLFFQKKYKESLLCFRKSDEISKEINLDLWRIGTVLGLAANKKELGIAINYDSLKNEIEKFYAQGNRKYEFNRNYLKYLIFEEFEYLELAYNNIQSISKQLSKKDRNKYLQCPIPKVIIEEYNKVIKK